MYKKIFILCVAVLLLNITMLGCGKNELTAVDTANLYLKAGLNSDLSVAKGTSLEDDIAAFVSSINSRKRAYWVYSILYNTFYTKGEFDRMISAGNSVRSKIKYQVDYADDSSSKTNSDTVNVRVTLTTVDTIKFKSNLKSIAFEKTNKDEKHLINSDNQYIAKEQAFPYFIDAFEEAAKAVKDEDINETKEYMLTFRHNKITNNWDLMNPREIILAIAQSDEIFYVYKGEESPYKR